MASKKATVSDRTTIEAQSRFLLTRREGFRSKAGREHTAVTDLQEVRAQPTQQQMKHHYTVSPSRKT